MKITCKKQGANKLISVDSEYEVISETDTRYTILNDSGVQKNYAKNLFEVTEEEEVPRARVRAPRAPRQPRPAPAVVEPVIPVIPTVDELIITTNAVYNANHNTVDFTIDVQFINNFTFQFAFSALNIYGSNISCGIKDLEGLNGFMAHFSTFLPQVARFINEHRRDFVLNADININEINVEVCDSLLQDLIALFQGGNINCGLIKLSTNVTDNNTLSNIVIEAIERIAQNTIEVRNPNSGRQIKLWTIVIQ